MTSVQEVLPGLVPTRPRDTALGRRILDAMREHGTARVLKHAALLARAVDRDLELEYRGNRRAA